MSTTIDAAIIKALVEHVGGDSSGIPDGTIGGGKTYTAGDGIDIKNDAISVKYDEDTMELKDGKISAKSSGADTFSQMTLKCTNCSQNAYSELVFHLDSYKDVTTGNIIRLKVSGVIETFVLLMNPFDSSGYNYQLLNLRNWSYTIYTGTVNPSDNTFTMSISANKYEMPSAESGTGLFTTTFTDGAITNVLFQALCFIMLTNH